MNYRFYNAGAANATTSAVIDVREDDEILQVVLNTSGVTFTDGDTCYVELSFISTPQKAINDAGNGVICQHFFTNELTTSGAAQSGFISQFDLPAIKIEGGERLYLHVVSTGTGTFPTYANVTTKQPGTRRAAKRR